MRMIARRPETWVFLILIGSYSYFWHRRDWNTASRLMLTYAFVDRGTVAITGLEIQTEDKAKFEGQFYSDKFPGFSVLATVPYAFSKVALGLPPHPINQKQAFPYWAADYWCTLGTSGLFTAGTAVLLALSARELGCSARTACFIALAYGLATPAYVYATLAYGHQTSAFALFASFFLLGKKAKRPRESYQLLLAGFLAAYAAVIELQVGPVSAILGFYLLAQCLRRDRRPDALALFAVGAMAPTLILLTYNQLAFGSPWDMGYSHHTTFGHVHKRRKSPRPDRPRSVLAKVVGLALGPPPRPCVLRSNPAARDSRLGRPGPPPKLGRGRGDVLRIHHSSARKLVLPRMDRRLVDRSAAAGAHAAVRNAARGRLARGRIAPREAGHQCRRRPRLGRWRADARVSIGRRADSTRLHRPPRADRLAGLHGPGSPAPLAI